MSELPNKYQNFQGILKSTLVLFNRICLPCLPLMIFVTCIYFIPLIFIQSHISLQEEQSFAFELGLFLYNLLIVSFFFPAILYGMRDLMQGKPFSLEKSLQFSTTKFYTVLFTLLITYTLTLMGLLAFYIPGLFLFFKFIFCVPLIVFDDLSASRSIIESWHLTKGAWFQTFALFFIVGFIGLFLIAGFNQLLAHHLSFVGKLFDIVLGSTISLFMLALLITQFNNLKILKKDNQKEESIDTKTKKPA